jgi:hypothetical protein
LRKRVQSPHGKNFTNRTEKIEIPQDEKASCDQGFDAQGASRKKASIRIENAGQPAF